MNYKQNRSDVALANAVFALDALISVLQILDSMVSLFDPGVANKLKHYTLEENRLAYVSKPKELLKVQVELPRSTMNAEAEAINLLTNDLNPSLEPRLYSRNSFIKLFR